MKSEKMIAKVLYYAVTFITWAAALLTGFALLALVIAKLGNIGLSFPTFLALMIPITGIDVLVVLLLQFGLWTLCVDGLCRKAKNNEG